MAGLRQRERSLPLLFAISICLLLLTRSLPQQCSASAAAPQSSDAGLLPEELAELDDLDDFEILSRKLSQADLLDSDEEAALDWEDEDEQESDLDGLEGEDDEGEEAEDEEEDDEEYTEEAEYEEDRQLDEKDVVVLTASNFTKFVESHSYVLVEFYAPWCGHCQSLAPHYADAATELKGEAVLAKVDATQNEDLAEQHDVQGYPTLLFFVDGVSKPYTGHRHREEIVKWVKKKIGPPAINISNVEEANVILRHENVVAVALLESLVGAEADELASAARQVDSVFFGQTSDLEVARVFQIGEGVKPPALVLLKDKANPLVYEGTFEKSKIAEFVDENRLPLVVTFSTETSSFIFDNDIKKQLLWFVASDEYERLLPHFEAAAKKFRGKIIFVHVNGTDEEISGPVKEFFGITDYTTTVIAFQAEEGGKKYRLEGEITADRVKDFVSDFLEEKLMPFLKSDPIPEVNDGFVKIVVGNNFDAIVLDETKDVLLELYAPWCGHCQAFEPIYERLAKRLNGVESLVIAKMDGTTNEHFRARPDGFPTILFFPAGKKSFDPIVVDAERTVKAYALFLKKHAAIPFTIPKIAPKVAPTEQQEVEQVAKDVDQLKDEL